MYKSDRTHSFPQLPRHFSFHPQLRKSPFSLQTFFQFRSFKLDRYPQHQGLDSDRVCPQFKFAELSLDVFCALYRLSLGLAPCVYCRRTSFEIACCGFERGEMYRPGSQAGRA
jgi:hypothetical protein